jgi:hypothetical protein
LSSETFEEIIKEKVLDELIHNFRCDIEQFWGISNVMSEDIGDRVKNLVRTVEKSDLAQLEKQIFKLKEDALAYPSKRFTEPLGEVNLAMYLTGLRDVLGILKAEKTEK